jgi:hypothetical protein
MEEDPDMLLVTFHGEPSGAVAETGINNTYAYDTKTKHIHSTQALANPSANMLSKLRSMVVANGYLYVTSGAKKTSTVLCYERISSAPSAHKSASAPLFAFVSTVIGPTIADKQFTTSIAHPFGIAFSTGGMVCYISNQDTNVVAQVTLTGNGQTGSLGSGSQSAYLSKLFPAPAIFLDGTFVASQQGALPDVAVVATSVSPGNGGLGVMLATKAEGADAGKKQKVQKSVRDVAIANDILFVCDEVHQSINMYSLKDGSFLTQAKLDGNPTHLASCKGGLFVSAGTKLFWGQLPAQPGAPLALTQVSLMPFATATKTDTIGGISFDSASATVYLPFQAGTGTVGARGGSIWTYYVDQPNPQTLPTFKHDALFVDHLPDTPELVLYMSD